MGLEEQRSIWRRRGIGSYGGFGLTWEDGGMEANDGAGGGVRGARVSHLGSLASDPTPRREGWRDERMNGDYGGGV